MRVTIKNQHLIPGSHRCIVCKRTKPEAIFKILSINKLRYRKTCNYCSSRNIERPKTRAERRAICVANVNNYFKGEEVNIPDKEERIKVKRTNKTGGIGVGVMRTNKTGYIGVSVLSKKGLPEGYIVKIISEKTLVLCSYYSDKDLNKKTLMRGAIDRDIYIIEHNLSNMRNFSDKELLEKMKYYKDVRYNDYSKKINEDSE